MSDSIPSTRDSERILATVADLAAAQLPLREGLRAAAAEATGGVARGLEALARQLEQGQTLEQVCADSNLRLPSHVRGMVAAAARTGQLGPALDELLEQQRSVRSMFWQIWGSMAYPGIVMLLNLVVIGFLLCWVVPVFKLMFLDFGLRLPVFTQAMIQVSDATLWLLIGPGRWGLLVGLIAILIFCYCAATGRGGARVQQLFIESLPLVGVLWQWSGAASFTYLLGILLDKQIPLAEGLRLAAAGTDKADLRRAGNWLADEVSNGRSLAELVESSGCLPASSVPLLRWGERNNALPEALRTLSEMFTERVQLRSEWLRSVSPPVIYVLIGMSAGAMVISLFTPLVSLITGLS